jgi:hypothetical protein
MKMERGFPDNLFITIKKDMFILKNILKDNKWQFNENTLPL